MRVSSLRVPAACGSEILVTAGVTEKGSALTLSKISGPSRATKSRKIDICSVSATAGLLCAATGANGAESLLLTNPTAHPVLSELWTIGVWTAPVFFLLQLGALFLLLWRVVVRWRPDLLGTRLLERWLLVLGATVAPVVMLFVSACFVGVYQSQRGHWFFHIHDGLAGLALLPLFAVGSVVVARGIFRSEYRLRSGMHFVVLLTLAAVSVWYAFATAFLNMATDPMLDLTLTAVVPAVAAANYALLAIDIRRHGRREPASQPAVFGWFTALAVSLAVKVPLAMRFFAALPAEPPEGYGDCFVVSAATRGHPHWVGSRYDPHLKRTVNRQWETLRAFEDRLSRNHPKLHRCLRGPYNRLGPLIAARVQSPWTADIVFLLLKPIEWLAKLYVCGGRFEEDNSDLASPTLPVGTAGTRHRNHVISVASVEKDKTDPEKKTNPLEEYPVKRHNRRQFLKAFTASTIALPLLPSLARSIECRIPHPLIPPNHHYKGQCPVCGMVRPMWARTWITFDPYDGVSQVCSFHCLADWIGKSGREPQHVQLTLYHQPDTSVPAVEAYIVMGSAAAGTMSPVSKIVFADQSKAVAFSQTCGGEVIDYAKALSAAKDSVRKENKMIHARRLEKEKIVEPGESDHCPVCNMYPIRYPYGKCQIRTKDNQTLHFCSTQCLFAFLNNPSNYIANPLTPLLLWVVDRNSGMWISGFSAFYVIGSSKVFGPMGYEAFPFNSREEAMAFTVENGGEVETFAAVDIFRIVPGWEYGSK